MSKEIISHKDLNSEAVEVSTVRKNRVSVEVCLDIEEPMKQLRDLENKLKEVEGVIDRIRNKTRDISIFPTVVNTNLNTNLNIDDLLKELTEKLKLSLTNI